MGSQLVFLLKIGATTILAAVHPEATADDIAQPGHVFPLEAMDGGVLARARTY